MNLNLETNAEPQLMKINEIRDKKNVGSGTSIEGIQRCFCMDIQRSERDSTRANTTQN
jgi:hypothetical protein